MGISIEPLGEGCCETVLNNYKIVITDKSRVDKSIKFVDYVLDFEDKFLLIEEKSFVLAILSPKGDEIEDREIERFSKLSNEEKSLKVCKESFRLLSDSNKKLKDTIIYLLKEKENFNIDKLQKSSFIYLYCKTDKLKEVDKLLISSLNMKNRKNIFIECSKLDYFIKTFKDLA